MSEAKLHKKSVAEKVEPLITAVAQSQNVWLYDLEYVKEGGDHILRLFIDQENGVDLNDCERVSRAAEAVLDEQDPIPDAYILEVSSPGIERRLRRDAHFQRYIGAKVEVKLYKPLDGKKKLRGILESAESGSVEITGEDGTRLHIEREWISRCRLVVFE